MTPVRSANELPNLDILRAVAVLLVVIDHSGKFFGLPPEYLNALGGTGVYLFFVHTCLVLMHSLERQEAKQQGHLALIFYVRRLFRIYPLSVCFVFVVWLTGVPAEHITGPFQIASFAPTRGDVLSNLTLTMNVTGHTPILGQLWSLPLEVQMYLLLPAAYLMARRFGAAAVFGGWCVSVAVAAAHTMLPFPGSWRLSLLQYVPCFLPGVLAYSLRKRRPVAHSAWWLPTLCAICAAHYMIDRPASRWLMCLAVGLAIPCFAQAKSRWLTRPAHYIAKYSYGIYLGHVLALWVGFSLFREPAVMQTALWLATLIVLPVAAFHLLESPGIALGVRISLLWASARRASAAGAAG